MNYTEHTAITRTTKAKVIVSEFRAALISLGYGMSFIRIFDAISADIANNLAYDPMVRPEIETSSTAHAKILLSNTIFNANTLLN